MKNDPAFPRLEKSSESGDGNFYHTSGGGLTKREYFAAIAMQGLIMSLSSKEQQLAKIEYLAKNSIKISDALIAAFEEVK